MEFRYPERDRPLEFQWPMVRQALIREAPTAWSSVEDLFNPFLNPLPDDKILDWSNLTQSADDNFKFDENSRKFSKRVENTVGKGEIARNEQFLLFPQCFQKACFTRRLQKMWLFGNGLIHHFETISNSKKLQTTNEMWLLKDFEIQSA